MSPEPAFAELLTATQVARAAGKATSVYAGPPPCLEVVDRGEHVKKRELCQPAPEGPQAVPWANLGAPQMSPLVCSLLPDRVDVGIGVE